MGSKKSEKRKTEANEEQVRNGRQYVKHQLDINWQSAKKTVSERVVHMLNNSDMSDIMFTYQ